MCFTHIQRQSIPHHAIHASTPNIQHIHLHPFYTIQCIHLYSTWNTTQWKYLHRVPYNEYTHHNTMTTWWIYIIPHAHNTTSTTCTQYHTYIGTICTTCAQYHIYIAPPTQHVDDITCTWHHQQHVHNTTCTLHHCTTCKQYHMYIVSHAWCVHVTICT